MDGSPGIGFFQNFIIESQFSEGRDVRNRGKDVGYAYLSSSLKGLTCPLNAPCLRLTQLLIIESVLSVLNEELVGLEILVSLGNVTIRQRGITISDHLTDQQKAWQRRSRRKFTRPNLPDGCSHQEKILCTHRLSGPS